MHPNKKAFKLSLFALLLITNLNAQESNKAINLQKVVVSTTGFEQDAVGGKIKFPFGKIKLP